MEEREARECEERGAATVEAADDASEWVESAEGAREWEEEKGDTLAAMYSTAS